MKSISLNVCVEDEKYEALVSALLSVLQSHHIDSSPASTAKRIDISGAACFIMSEPFLPQVATAGFMGHETETLAVPEIPSIAEPTLSPELEAEYAADVAAQPEHSSEIIVIPLPCEIQSTEAPAEVSAIDSEPMPEPLEKSWQEFCPSSDVLASLPQIRILGIATSRRVPCLQHDGSVSYLFVNDIREEFSGMAVAFTYMDTEVVYPLAHPTVHSGTGEYNIECAIGFSDSADVKHGIVRVVQSPTTENYLVLGKNFS
jgi:hypothetical protein